MKKKCLFQRWEKKPSHCVGKSTESSRDWQPNPDAGLDRIRTWVTGEKQRKNYRLRQPNSPTTHSFHTLQAFNFPKTLKSSLFVTALDKCPQILVPRTLLHHDLDDFCVLSEWECAPMLQWNNAGNSYIHTPWSGSRAWISVDGSVNNQVQGTIHICTLRCILWCIPGTVCDYTVGE